MLRSSKLKNEEIAEKNPGKKLFCSPGWNGLTTQKLSWSSSALTGFAALHSAVNCRNVRSQLSSFLNCWGCCYSERFLGPFLIQQWEWKNVSKWPNLQLYVTYTVTFGQYGNFERLTLNLIHGPQCALVQSIILQFKWNSNLQSTRSHNTCIQ